MSLMRREWCRTPLIYLELRRMSLKAAALGTSGVYGARFRQKFTLEDAIGSHACSLEANTRVTNGIPIGSSPLLPVDTVICVQTLKAFSTPNREQSCLQLACGTVACGWIHHLFVRIGVLVARCLLSLCYHGFCHRPYALRDPFPQHKQVCLHASRGSVL
jgi:hypothetical protein